MSQRPIQFAPGEYYHIYNRGTDKRQIFFDKADHQRFISLLYLCNNGIPTHRSDLARQSFRELFSVARETTLTDVGAYCLMPNHFHILLHEQSENGISTFMQKLSTAYAMYFNKRYDRNGSLFQGKFKAVHVKNDNQLKYLLAYIHLNPLGIINKDWKKHRLEKKTESEEFIESYRYSSYADYAKKGGRPEGIILNKLAFPAYFEKEKDFKEYVGEWIKYANEGEQSFEGIHVKARP